jgi:hypothetical protein
MDFSQGSDLSHSKACPDPEGITLRRKNNILVTTFLNRQVDYPILGNKSYERAVDGFSEALLRETVFQLVASWFKSVGQQRSGF